MKFAKVVIVASALAVPAFSLSGCSTSAQSQPAQATAVLNHWNAKIGQKCTVYCESELPIYEVLAGTLKSADDSWVVVSNFADPLNSQFTEIHIRASDVIRITFPEDRSKKK